MKYIKRSKECWPRPFISRAGSKVPLLEKLCEDLPSFNAYFEPFLGGGAMYLQLQPSVAYLSDFDSNLMLVWEQIKTDPFPVMEYLDSYLSDRATFDLLRGRYDTAVFAEKAAIYIYMNRHCFRGQFFYRHGNLTASWYAGNNRLCSYEEGNIRAIHSLLQNSYLSTCSYQYILEIVKPGDLVFLDPPYLGTSDIYLEEDFGPSQQMTLAGVFDTLASSGVHVILTNADSDNMQCFYKKYRRESVTVPRKLAAGIGGYSQKDIIVRSW